MRIVVSAIGLALLAAACGGEAPTAWSPLTRLAPTSDALTRPLPLTDPADTPPTDLTNAVVSLDTVVFDTFDGGSVTLDRADRALIDRLFDAIPPIDAPNYVPATEAQQWLSPVERVVGFVDAAGLAWAYPIRILNYHEIVNDELSGDPVLISYCPLCGSGVVFDRRIDEQTLSFSNTSALHENDLVMVDRETGTYWWQVAGSGLVGELAGRTLSVLPSETTTWESWLRRHPATEVLEKPPGQRYDRDPFLAIGDSIDRGSTPFPVSPEVFSDTRLEPSTRVVVVEFGNEMWAWPTAPARTVTDMVAGVPLTLVADGTGAFVQGPEGLLPLRSSFWFAVVAAFPGVVIGS